MAQFGIDPSKPAETYDLCGDPKHPGNILYGGWVHFIGDILAAPVADANSKDVMVSRELDGSTLYFKFEGLNERLSVLFREGHALAHKPFRSQKLVQLEFQTSLPWVRDDAYEL